MSEPGEKFLRSEKNVPKGEKPPTEKELRGKFIPKGEAFRYNPEISKTVEEPNLEKERKFIDWLQERISSPVLKRRQKILEQKQKLLGQSSKWIDRVKAKIYQRKIIAIEKKLSEAEKTHQYLSSKDFREKLAKWQPWRLNEKSVETGKNLYIRAAKGYASESFLDWTKEEAEKYHTTQNKILAGIIETVRKIEWETMKVMASKGIATEYTLPHLVIGRSPAADVDLFNNSLKEAKKAPQKIAGLFSREDARLQMGKDDIIVTKLLDIIQMTGELYGDGGRGLVGGSFSEKTVGIYDKNIENLFSFAERKKTIAGIVEEETHHQGYKTSEIKEEKDDSFNKYKGESLGTGALKALMEGEKAEKAVEFKKMVEEITRELPSLEKLLEPFYQRVSQKPK